ncbi:MAG: acyltransferase [Candidatus Limisoma sp.]|nr:acyltransferase [Candidatus Limisoma sp.]
MSKVISDESIQRVNQGNCFGFIRYVLAIDVIVGHFYTLLNPDIGFWHYNGYRFPEAGFFVLSGFLVFLSYHLSPNLKVYFGKRARRLVPAYVAVVLLCVALGALITTLSPSEFFGSAHFWRYFFANITLMNFIEPTMPGVFDGNLVAAVNGSLWTIKAEVLLYFTVPVIYVLAQRFGKTRVIVTVFALLTVAFTGCVYVYETTGNEAINMLAHKVLLPFGYFYAGTAILLYLEKFLRNVWWLLAVAVVLFMLRSTSAVLLELAPFSLAVIIGAVGMKCRWLNRLGRHNNITFGMYLYHFPVIQVVGMCGLQHVSLALSMVVVFAVTIAISLLSWFLLEKPIIEHKRLFEPLLRAAVVKKTSKK